MRIPPLVRVIVLFTAVVALGVAIFIFINNQRSTGEQRARPLSIGAAVPGERDMTGITVQGRGEVRVKPDSAFVSVGVEHIAPTAGEASAALADVSNSVVNALKALNIDPKDIATQSLSLTPVYEEPAADGGKRQLTGYRASTSLLITVREIARASEVLDTAIAAGSNLVNFVRFGVADPEPLKREALDAATRDAALKAEAMATALGGKLGGLLWINEESFVFIQAQQAAPRGFAGGAPGEFGPSVEAGELTIEATVRANFAYE